MENKFLHNNQTNSLFNSAYQATNKCFKQTAITGVSNQSDVLKNTSILSKSQPMKYPTTSIQQAQNLTGYSICTASNNNNFQMKNTKFKSFVFALMAMLLMFSSKNAMASPGNKVFIDASFSGALPPANHMQFCLPDTFRVSLTNLTSDPLTGVTFYVNFMQRDPVTGVIDSTQEFVRYAGNNNGYSATIHGNGAVTIDITGGFAANETKTIEFYGFLTCNGYKAIKDEAVLRNFYKVSYTSPVGFNHDSISTNDYFPSIPKIVVTSVTPSTADVTFGDVVVRDITIVNGGFGTLKEFYVNDYHGTSFVVDSIRTSDGAIVQNTGTHLQILLDSAYLANRYGSGLFGLNDNIVIREYLRVINCTPTQAQSRINAAFGCNYEG